MSNAFYFLLQDCRSNLDISYFRFSYEKIKNGCDVKRLKECALALIKFPFCHTGYGDADLFSLMDNYEVTLLQEGVN